MTVEASCQIKDELLYAARTGDIDCLKSNEEFLRQCEGILHYASGNDHIDVVEYLLELQFSPNSLNKDKNTPLHWCALTNSIDSAKLLLRYGGDPRILNRQGKSAISIALQHNHNDLLEVLAESGMDFEDEEESD